MRTIRLFVILAIACGVTVNLDAQQEPSFNISSNETYYPGQKPHIAVWATGVPALEFRVYRVNDPIKFFGQLQEQHRFGGQGPRIAHERTWLEEFHDWKHERWAEVRDLIRAQFDRDSRASIRQWRLQQHVPSVSTGETYAQVPLLNAQQLVSAWRWSPPRGQYAWQSDSVAIPVNDAGVYLIEATDGNLRAYTVVIVTEIAVITKTSRGQLINYVVDRKSGELIRKATVMAWADKQAIATRQTDDNGLAPVQVDISNPEDVLVLVSDGRRFAANAPFAWNVGTSTQNLQSYAYTDRPVYRPGDSMRFKFIVRAKAPMGYQLPSAREIRIDITDANGNAKLQKTFALSDMGTASGEFAIPSDAALGFWSINASIGEVHLGGASFSVEEYKKPEYQVRVTPESSRIVQGQPIKATIDARYYFGEPVANAKVTWVAHRIPWWAPGRYYDEDASAEAGEGGEEAGEGEEEGDAGDYTYGAQQTEQQTGKLDSDGKLQIRLATKPDDKKQDIRYRIEARVTDEGNREIAGAGSVVATYANYYIDAYPDSYVYTAGGSARLTVNARDYDGHPIQTNFHVELSRWSWRSQESSKTLWSSDARTGADGKGEVQVRIPESGEFRVRVTAPSPEKREVRTDTFLWAPGGTPWWSGGGERESIKIVTDKKEYKPGDTARVAVFAGRDAPRVLVSVEGSYLYSYEVVPNKEGSVVVDIPIRAEYAPNVFVSATYISGNKLHQGQKRIAVPPTAHALSVELAPAKPQFKPGEPALYTIRAHDANNRPVQAEFSIGVVDEAVYAVRPETVTDIMTAFYGRVYDQVGTQTSLNYYFSGAAGKRKMQLANVRPHSALAQLKPERLVQPKVRKAFPDTAYWIGDIRTNANGEAQARFNWPDALTTWRATTRGVTRDTKVGSAVEKTIVRKNLMVRLVVPRFFRQGDEITLSTIVHNYLANAKTARVAMEFDGLQVIDGAQRDINVGSRDEVKVDWRVRVQNVMQARVLGKALTDEESDAMELTLPVEPFGVKVADARSGAISDSSEQQDQVTFAADAQPGTRTLQISMTASVAGAIFGALDYLTSYPYGCTEQTMSSFLPNVVVAQAMKSLGITEGINTTELNKKVAAGLDRLYDYQHEDGGWGWWKTDDTNIFMTAYVLGGLVQGRDAGYQVREDVVDRARKWLRRKYDEDANINPDQRAYAAYALALSGDKDRILLDKAWEKRSSLSPYGTAVLGLAALSAADSRVGAIADTLEAQVHSDGQQAYWESQHNWLLDFSGEASVEATGFALKFLSAVRPRSPLLPKAALYLLAHRNEGFYWTSTEQTAMAVFGLTDYVRQGSELSPDFTATVYVGDRKVLTKHFSAAEARQPAVIIRLDEDQVAAGTNTIRVTKSGAGRLYWSARAEAYSSARRLINAGSTQLSLTREYFRLSPARKDDKIVYHLDPMPDTVQSGDVLAVRLTVGGGDWRYLMIEDPLPAGTESIARDDLYELDSKPNWWSRWFTERELHDDRTTFFQTWFNHGSHEFVYLLKVVNPGQFRISPARVEPMYQPAYTATSDTKTVTVQ